MLKKLLGMTIAGVFLAVASASADINIIYSGVDGFLRSDDATGLTEPIAGNFTALAQLVFSTDNITDDATVGGGFNGTDTVLAEVLIDNKAGTDAYGFLPAQSYSDTFQAGFIYVRIFDQGTGLGGAGVGVGTWYYDGPVVATIDNVTPANPDSYNAQGANPSVTFSGFGDFLNEQVVVPEPATFALMGLGGLALAIRRRRNV